MELYPMSQVPPVSALKQFQVRFPERAVQLGPTSWRYWTAGARGRGLLLLGRAASFGDSNYPLIEQFRWTRRVLSPSYPLLGSVGAVADGLVRLMDHEKLDKADVFGDALGAGVAQVLARRHPDRIDRIALASFGRHSPRHTLLARLHVGLMRLLPHAAHQALLRRRMLRMTAMLPSTHRSEVDTLIADLVERSSKELVMRNLALTSDLFDRSRNYHLDEPLERRGRVLLLLADDDAGFTALERERLVDTWPGAEVHAFVSGGPLLALTRRGEFGRALDRFYGDAAPRWISGPRPPTAGPGP